MRNKIVVIVLAITIAAAGIAFIKVKAAGYVNSKLGPSSSAEIVFDEQTSDENQVTVAVQPIVANGDLRLVVKLNTHSVELDDDLAQSIAVLDSKGKEMRSSSYQGDPPGGHHRTGELVFSGFKADSGRLIVIGRDIGGVTERRFEWSLNK